VITVSRSVRPERSIASDSFSPFAFKSNVKRIRAIVTIKGKTENFKSELTLKLVPHIAQQGVQLPRRPFSKLQEYNAPQNKGLDSLAGCETQRMMNRPHPNGPG
jgi:hypothetical protein